MLQCPLCAGLPCKVTLHTVSYYMPDRCMWVQGQAPGAPKGVRIAKGPDGSKGFAPGRGRPLPPQPASAPQPAPGSVRSPGWCPTVVYVDWVCCQQLCEAIQK